jgi:hypothetical protein
LGPCLSKANEGENCYKPNCQRSRGFRHYSIEYQKY